MRRNVIERKKENHVERQYAAEKRIAYVLQTEARERERNRKEKQNHSTV